MSVAIQDVLGLVRQCYDPREPSAHADDQARKILADIVDEYCGDWGYYFARDLREPAKRPTDYRKNANEDARETVREYLDQIVALLLAGNEVSDDLYNDYADGDAFHHERHVDRYYRLLEAAECISQLSEFEETDDGLWQGIEGFETAAGVCAAYTYGGAVMSMWQHYIKEINEDTELLDIQGDEELTTPVRTERIRERVLKIIEG